MMTAMEQANAGHMRDAQALADMKNYLLKFPKYGKEYLAKGAIALVKVWNHFIGAVQCQMEVDQLEYCANLVLLNEFCESCGLLRETQTKANLERMIAHCIPEEEQRLKAYAEGLKTSVDDLLKDGKIMAAWKN